MPSQCSRCNKFISEEEKVVLDLEEYHDECAIQRIRETLPEMSPEKEEVVKEKVRKAKKLQFSRRRGLEIIN